DRRLPPIAALAGRELGHEAELLGSRLEREQHLVVRRVARRAGPGRARPDLVALAHRGSAILGEDAVRIGAAVAEELPGAAHLLDHVEVELADDQLVLVAATHRDELAARVDEVRLTVELADVPR